MTTIGAIDHFCLDGADPGWTAECPALVPPGQCMERCEYGPTSTMIIDCAYGADMPCASGDEASRTAFAADGLFAPTSTFSFPDTRVDFLFGTMDCGDSAVPSGLYYQGQITSDQSVAFVAAPHPLFSVAAGADAIEAAIEADCRPRH